MQVYILWMPRCGYPWSQCCCGWHRSGSWSPGGQAAVRCDFLESPAPPAQADPRMYRRRWTLSRWRLSRSSSACLEGGKQENTPWNIIVKWLRVGWIPGQPPLHLFPFLSKFMHFHSTRTPTHGGKVGFVDLGDSVVAGIEVSGVFGERWHAIQLQVVTIDRAAEACAQQTSGHTWSR